MTLHNIIPVSLVLSIIHHGIVLLKRSVIADSGFREGKWDATVDADRTAGVEKAEKCMAKVQRAVVLYGEGDRGAYEEVEGSRAEGERRSGVRL